MTNYPNIDDVRFIVKLLNQRYNEDDIRISNEGQLKLLLEKPQMTLYGHTRYPELHQKIAVLMEGLTKGHVLGNGNKRCAMMTAQLMAQLNDAYLSLPLKAIRLSVDTAMDSDDKMTEEIQQWFKVHVTKDPNHYSILLEEQIEEIAIIDNLREQKKYKEADELLSKWMAFDGYPEHKKQWEQLKEKWEKQNPAKHPHQSVKEFLNPITNNAQLLKNLDYFTYQTKEIKEVGKLSIMNHTLEELLQYEENIKKSLNQLENTTDASLLYNSAYILDIFDESEKALENYEKILKIDPAWDHVNASIGIIYLLKLRDYQKAVDCFKKYLKLNPTMTHVRHLMTLGLYYLNRDQEALKEINELIKIDPEMSQAHHLKSMIQARLGDVNAARETIKHVLYKIPLNSENVMGIIFMILDLHRYNKMIKELKKPTSVGLGLSDAGLYTPKSIMFFRDIDNTIEQCRLKLEKEPNDPKSLIGIGMAYSDMEEYEKALRYLNRALEIEPKNESILPVIAIMQSMTGKHAEAVKFIIRSLELTHETVLSRFLT